MTGYRDLLLFVIAFLVYNDGIQTVIVMAIPFGKETLGIGTPTLMAVLVLIVAVWPIFQPRLDTVRQGIVAFTWDDFEEYPVPPNSSSGDVQALLRLSLADAPENAIIFLDWDMLYPSYYVAHIELDRTDLMFVETYPADDQDSLADSVLEFIATRQAEHPVFVSDRLPELSAAGYYLAPLRVGPTRLYRVVQRDE